MSSVTSARHSTTPGKQCLRPVQVGCHRHVHATPLSVILQNCCHQRVWQRSEFAHSAPGVTRIRRRRTITAAEAKGTKTTYSEFINTLILLALFGVWYMSNIYFNIYNKQVLQAFPHPLTCTFIHLMVSSLLAVLLWITRLQRTPPVTPDIVDIMFPLGLLHMIGFWTTNASLGSVAVSLTHTVKALEPFFTVMLSWLLMGLKPASRVLLAILPIVVGVIVASATDVSFNWWGFNAAMLSNLAFQCRNVLSKKAMLRTSYLSLEGGNTDYSRLDEVNIFALMSIFAMLLLMPVVIFVDWPSIMVEMSLNSPLEAQYMMSSSLWLKVVLAGICRFGDVLASFLILQRVIPVTHSVGNCVKRVVVIAASILFFKTPASYLNILGTGIALAGVLCYSFVKRMSKDKLDVEVAMKTTVLEDTIAAVSPGTLYLKLRAALGMEPKRKETKASEDGDLEYYL